MSLDKIQENTKVRVVKITTNKSVKNKLSQLSVLEGVELVCLRRAPLGGPILVCAGGREVAIGRKLASKIEVEIIA